MGGGDGVIQDRPAQISCRCSVSRRGEYIAGSREGCTATSCRKSVASVGVASVCGGCRGGNRDASGFSEARRHLRLFAVDPEAARRKDDPAAQSLAIARFRIDARQPRNRFDHGARVGLTFSRDVMGAAVRNR